MATGVAKLQLLIELNNKLKGGLDKAKKQVNKATGDMQNKLNDFKIKNIKAFDAIKEQVPGVSKAISMLSNPYMLAAAAVMALSMAIVSCTKKANEWHEKMAEINVTAELSKKELGNLSDKLLDIGGRNVAPLEEVPKAFNRIISAGLSVEKSLETLEPTLRAAKAGFTEIEIAAGAATSVMMSTGYDAKRVYDILFETVKEGNAEFKDIAQYLPKVIPLAKNVGYELEEVAGAYAMLTGRLSTEQSTTALQGVMRALSSQRVAIGELDKETGKYVSGFKSIGIDVFDPTTKKIKPILQIVTELSKKMEGLSDKERMLRFDRIGLDQMGSLGISSLMQDLPGLKKAIEATTNSAGAMEKAYKDSLTPMESWKILQNKIQVGMIKIGEYFLPIVSAIGEKILELIQKLKDLYKNNIFIRDIITVIGVAFQTSFKLAIRPIKSVIDTIKYLWQAIKSVGTALSEWLSNITGIKGGFTGMYNFVRPYLIWMKDFLSSIGDIMYDVFTLNFQGAKDKIKNFQLPDLDEIRQKIKVEQEMQTGDFAGVPTASGFEPDNDDDGDPLGAAHTISGGSQTRNITINIGSLHDGDNIISSSETAGMSISEFEKWMIEKYMRVIRSAETSM
ncbi:phage tail tape measure protein [Paludibacteraceae bacterium OttesenSCG-928-F17]|nr:phage tail tape measure protein [Paludibacteraceae bacterium OttesenSCG-928-F17]